MCLAFTAVTERLRTRSGLIAWLPVRDSSAHGMLALSSKALASFATLHAGSARAKFVAPCRRLLRTKTHHTTTDSASNETLAATLQKIAVQEVRCPPRNPSDNEPRAQNDAC